MIKLLPVVQNLIKKRKDFLKLAYQAGTPLYVFDHEALEESIENFERAFRRIPRLTSYFAMKSNHHPYIIDGVLKHHFGLDVSSGMELEIALKHKAEKIIFSGPGKTEAELALAVEHHNKVIINMDSFSELRKLGIIAAKSKRIIKAGIRIYTQFHGSWSKFGIPIDELKFFWNEAQKYPYINLAGIQVHVSWNKTGELYGSVLKELSDYLKNFSPEMLRKIKFIDFGGGFFPSNTEGSYPWTAHYPWQSPAGKILKITNDFLGKKTHFKEKYHVTETVSLDAYAKIIEQAISAYLKPLVDCDYFTEPGRIICNNAMHILVTVLDVKKTGFVITDGGVNSVGWEYGEHFYYPLVNMTHPAEKEIACTMYGPLCTPHDIWGYYCYAKKIQEGDVILVPFQGAYKYVLAQNFIKPMPEVVRL